MKEKLLRFADDRVCVFILPYFLSQLRQQRENWTRPQRNIFPLSSVRLLDAESKTNREFRRRIL